MFAGKLSTVECTHLITYWASNHGKLDLNLFSCGSLDYFKDVSIKDVRHLPYKVIFGINETQYFSVTAKDSNVLLLSIHFSVEVVVGIERWISLGQGCRVNNSPALMKDL